MEINLPAYKIYLQSKKYSPATIRNYLSDLNRYSTYGSFELYLNSIKHDPNYPRYISSLNRYFEFAVDQKLIKKNPIKEMDRKPKLEINLLLDQYKTYLQKKHKMPFTVKNYINDIKQFINFCES
jgi:hypothetical protein